MPTFSIESNGMIEKTAVYYNGMQLAGVKEVYIHINEEGDFDSVIQYEDTLGNIVSKQIFTEYLSNVRTSEPTFTEEDAEKLVLLTVESEGELDDTAILINEQYEDGIVDLFIHVKAVKAPEQGFIASIFNKEKSYDQSIFKHEITFRNEDGSTEMDFIF